MLLRAKAVNIGVHIFDRTRQQRARGAQCDRQEKADTEINRCYAGRFYAIAEENHGELSIRTFELRGELRDLE